MIILRVLQRFLLPSGVVLLFIALGLLLLFLKKRERLGKGLVTAGIVLYFLFSITPVSNFLLTPLEGPYEFLSSEEMEEADKIVLLLGGRESNVLRGSEVLRIWHLSQTPKKVIISGTDPFLETSQEASAVKAFFANRGIDYQDIVIEGRSRNTRENVKNVKELVGEKDFFLVTSAYHMNRSLREFERAGANPIPAPTDFKRKREGPYRFFDFFPHIDNLKKSDLAVHEHLGSVYYGIRSFLF